MNTYYSELGRKLVGQTPITAEGFYVLHDNDEVSLSLTPPEGIPLITAEHFVQALTEGCKTIIREFAALPENKDVYAFNLYADDHNCFLVYMNTEECFTATLDNYEHEDPTKINSIKYNQGDFDYHFWNEHMGESGEIIAQLEKTAYGATDLEDDASIEIITSEPVVAFEAGIVKMGYQALALQAVQRLIEDDAFAQLRKTEQFIAYAATGNDYVDYSIIMRKTIDPALFAALFPDTRELDQQYSQELESYRNLTVSEAIDYWMEAVHDGYHLSSPYRYLKSEFEVLVQLAPFGNMLAVECLPRIMRLAGQNELSRADMEELSYYIECLHFSGDLTAQQQEDCRQAAELLDEKHKDLKAEARQLLLFANQ